MNYKIRCIREKMKLLNIQGLIITNPLNIRYIIGIPVEGKILITDRENIFITDARYIEEVNGFLTINDEFVIYDAKDLSETDNQNFFQNCENVGFEENYVTFAEYENIIRKYICTADTDCHIIQNSIVRVTVPNLTASAVLKCKPTFFHIRIEQQIVVLCR